MKFPDFGKCQVRSIYLAKAMEKEGYCPKVLYGIFTPTTARKTWDERWRSATGNEFVHFWLAFSDRFYDYSAFQFGEKAPIKTSIHDKRYEILGECNYKTGELTVTGQFMIEWESYSETKGVPVLKLVPIFV